MIKKAIVLLCLFSVFRVPPFAQQSKEEIQRKQQQLQRELADLNSTLNEIKKSKKQSLSQLALVQRKIKAREELVSSINKELHKIDDDIYLNSLDIYRYKKELDTLKERYAKNLVFAYKNRSNYDYLNFIFSANNFNDAHEADFVPEKLPAIPRNAGKQHYANTKPAAGKNEQAEPTKTQKNSTLQEQGKQIKQMELDKKEKDEVVHSLQGKEKELSAQISDREATAQKLQAQLQLIIRREIAEAKRKEQERQAQLARQKEEERKRKLAEQQALAKANSCQYRR